MRALIPSMLLGAALGAACSGNPVKNATTAGTSAAAASSSSVSSGTSSGTTSAGASSSGSSVTSSSSGTTSGASSSTGSTSGTTGCTAYALQPRISAGAAYGGDGLLYIAGGLDQNENVTGLVEAVNPVSGDVALGALLTARYGLAVAAGPDGNVYTAGGVLEDGGVTAAFEVYDTDAGAWSTLADVPIAGGAIGAFVGQALYVLVSNVGVTGQVLETYDLGSQSWGQPSAFPATYTSGMSAAGASDNLYVLLSPAGAALFPSPQGLAALATNTGTWSALPNELAEPATSYSGSALVAIGNDVYGVGGGGASGELVPYLQMYDPGTSTWSMLADMPTARVGLSAVNVDGELYAIDGQGQPAYNPDSGVLLFQQPLGLIEVYNPGTALWHGFSVGCQAGATSGTTGGSTSGGTTSGGPPVDAGVCNGTFTQTGTVMPLEGGAFNVTAPAAGAYGTLLVQLEDDCDLICASPYSLNGEYQWLDLELYAGSGYVVPGTYAISELPPNPPGAPGALPADGGAAVVSLAFDETKNALSGGVSSVMASSGTVTLSSLSATSVSASYSTVIPEVDDGGIVYDGGVEIRIPSTGSFTVPAASCTLQSTIVNF